MDSLVAQYSRPAYADEGQSQDEMAELQALTLGSAPDLSLKFAVPPIAQVKPPQL